MRIVEDELEAYGEGLEDKPRLVALNKVDLADAELGEGFSDGTQGRGRRRRCSAISGATGEGIEALLDAVLAYLPDRTATETKGSEVEDEGDEARPGWSPL